MSDGQFAFGRAERERFRVVVRRTTYTSGIVPLCAARRSVGLELVLYSSAWLYPVVMMQCIPLGKVSVQIRAVASQAYAPASASNLHHSGSAVAFETSGSLVLAAPVEVALCNVTWLAQSQPVQSQSA